MLGLDMVVAWMVIQGAYTYLGMVWHGLAAESLSPGAMESHGRQFLVLRGIQIATWLAIAALVLAWRRRVRRAAAGHGATEWGPLGRVGLALVGVAALAHGLAAALAARPLMPLDLGGPLQLLVLGALLEILAAVVAIVLVRRVTAGRQMPAEPSTLP